MEFLIKRSKLFYIIYGVLCFAVIISAAIYMTQYANIRVLYATPNGGIEFKTDGVNQYFMDFYSKNNIPNVTDDMWKLYHIQWDFINFNNLILYFGVTALVLFAVMMVFGNQSRNVYYLSNLIVGTAVPGVISVLSIVLIALNSGFYGTINNNFDLVNRANLLMEEKTAAINSQKDIAALRELYSIDTLTITLYNVFFVIVLVASLAMCGYAVYRYIASGEKRKEIIARAVSENE